MSKTEKQQMSCNVCQKRSINKPAVKYCPHCEDGLCKECSDHHGSSTATTHHHTIVVDEYNKLPKCVSTVRHRCEPHKSEFEFYCVEHGVACCVDCTTDTHNACANLQPLHVVVKGFKSSAQLQEVEKQIANIEANIIKLTEERQANISALERQKLRHVDTIKQMRQTINDHLDKVEASILQDLSNKLDASKLQIEALINKLNIRKKRANAIQDEIKITKQAASQLQTFIGIRDIDKRIQDESKSLVTLQDDENFYHSDLHINFSETLSKFADLVPNFGEVLMQTSPKNLNLVTSGKRRPSQAILPKAKGIDSIRIHLAEKIRLRNNKGFELSGCEIISNGKLLFIDMNHEHLLSCNIDGSELVTLSDLTSTGPFDVVNVTEDTVAVTLRKTRAVALIENTTGVVTKKLNVSGECYGIHYRDGKFLVRLVDEGVFLLMDLNGKVLSRVKYPAERLRYFSFYMDKIYCTITGKNVVLCMNMKGAEIWSYQNVQLREPLGIGVDANGFVYVAGKLSNSVVLISPDGRGSKVILSERDGILKPQALTVSNLRRQLLVCNKLGGSAYLYSY